MSLFRKKPVPVQPITTDADALVADFRAQFAELKAVGKRLKKEHNITVRLSFDDYHYAEMSGISIYEIKRRIEELF